MFANIRAVLVYPEPSFFLYRIVLVREQFVILSRTGGLQRQSNLFPFFLSLSLDIKHELKIHILDILNAVYLLLVQIGCFYISKKFCNSATNHTLPYRYGAERGVDTFHFIAKGVWFWNHQTSKRQYNVSLTVNSKRLWKALSVTTARN